MSTPTNAAIVDTRKRKWIPFESHGSTGHVSYTEDTGDIYVPYGKDPMSRMVQAHELAHVKWSARIWPDLAPALKLLTKAAGTTPAIVGFAEDMRITALAGRLAIKTLPAFDCDDDRDMIDAWIESFTRAGVPADRVDRAVRFILNEHTTIAATLGIDLEDLDSKKDATRYVIHCATLLHKLLSRGEDPPPPPSDKGKAKGPKGEPSEDTGEGSEGEGDAGEGSEGEPSEDAGEGEGEGEGEGSEGDTGEGSEGDTGEGEGEGEGEGSEGGGKTGKGGGCKGDTIDLSAVVLPDIKGTMLAHVPAPPSADRNTMEFQKILSEAKWIPVARFERPALVRRAAIARRKGRKFSESGVALGNAYAAVSPSDRRPFVDKRSGGNGGLTVLVDCSGSMSIKEKELETLLTAYPQGVVVTYSSRVVPRGKYGKYRYSDITEDQAIVRIIASHGRICAPENFRDMRAGGNGCDGPCLEWLAKQTGERVWICDGFITGKGDTYVAHEGCQRDAWLAAKRITRFYSLREYLATLADKGKGKA